MRALTTAEAGAPFRPAVRCRNVEGGAGHVHRDGDGRSAGLRIFWCAPADITGSGATDMARTTTCTHGIGPHFAKGENAAYVASMPPGLKPASGSFRLWLGYGVPGVQKLHGELQARTTEFGFTSANVGLWLSRDLGGGQAEPLTAQVSAGAWDDHLRKLASALAFYGLPVWLRIHPECNGTWPSGLQVPVAFVQAFRRVCGILVERGATNVVPVWHVHARGLDPLGREKGPLGLPGAWRFFPGWQYVGALGLSVYDAHDLQAAPGLIAKARAAGRPTVLSEVSCALPGTDSPAAVSEFFAPLAALLEQHDDVRACWYGEHDWATGQGAATWKDGRIVGSIPSVRAAWQAVLSEPWLVHRGAL